MMYMFLIQTVIGTQTELNQTGTCAQKMILQS